MDETSLQLQPTKRIVILISILKKGLEDFTFLDKVEDFTCRGINFFVWKNRHPIVQDIYGLSMTMCKQPEFSEISISLEKCNFSLC
jgi:hypothetical protein